MKNYYYYMSYASFMITPAKLFATNITYILVLHILVSDLKFRKRIFIKISGKDVQLRSLLRPLYEISARL